MVLIRRGEIWVAHLNPHQGAEIGKVRPVVAIQADPLTQAGLATLLVVPLTTQHRPAAALLRIRIQARDRLLQDCYAMADQPRALARTRIGDGPLTTLTAKEMAALERGLRSVMGLA